MPFNQPPPELGNQFEDDTFLRGHLRRVLGEELLTELESEFHRLGDLAGGELYRMQLAEHDQEPRLEQWNAWGERVDEIVVTPLWERAERLAAELGLVATAYECKHGALSRVHQFALVYLFSPSTDVYSCPLAMTDGAARTLLDTGNQALIDRALPHLTSRDADIFWTSGQWMTESTGGSDVGTSETVARHDVGALFRLEGRKWFTSAAASQMALTLARPEGNAPGGRGLALFYVETRGDDGRLQAIRLNRLKDKLGTKKLPTAELMLEGTPATAVCGTDNGVRNITPMLNITRTWNAVVAVSGMRRAIALARDYGRRRVAFGAKLSDKPLHVDTLAGLMAEFAGAFCLAFFVVELIGKMETKQASEHELALLRLLTPIAKLTTAKQAVHVASEVLEIFGGAGYVEDTGLPALLRDAQVLPIWEGTTNVLSLDVLRALSRGPGLDALEILLRECRAQVTDPALEKACQVAQKALLSAASWLTEASKAGTSEVEAGARRFALTLGRSTELALLCRHGQWAMDHDDDRGPRAAAVRLAQAGVNRIAWYDAGDSKLLAGG